MTEYYLGVDIGGTKSHALIADEAGRVVGFGETGPGSHEVVGYEGLSVAIHTILDQAVRSAGIAKSQIAGAGFGIAGYDWPSERGPMRQIIESLGFGAPYELVNDAVIGLIAGASQGWGVAVVAGTSCNCRGRDPYGREGRVTGCGPAYGENAGGTELVAKAIEAVALAWTKRGPATILTERFIEAAGAHDVVDLLQGLSRGRYRLRASTAPIVFAAAETGDEVAASLIAWAGQELGSLAVGVIRQLEFESLKFEVVQAGSFYKGSPVITEMMRRVVHQVAPLAEFVRLDVPPVIGGVLLGVEQSGTKYLHLREDLIRSFREHIPDYVMPS